MHLSKASVMPMLIQSALSMASDLGKQFRLVQETEKETFKACLQFDT